MHFKELAIVFLITLADMLTTNMLMSITNNCCLEHNLFLKSLCNEIGYVATWIWLPVEFIAIASIYTLLEKLRERLGARIEVEKIFIVLILVPMVNNLIHLMCLH
jgi:hypothetical protein